MSGKQIKLFLVDGTPGGLTTAEITNWTGHVLAARRSDLADLLGREEAQRTGVYFLLGDDESIAGDTRCYIGEADVVAERLRYHQRDKEFWDRVVVITSKDSNITKAHGRYLESKLIALAIEAGRVTLENKDRPPVPALPEADASDMDYFLAQLQIVLPVLGINAIRVRGVTPAAVAERPSESPVFRLTNVKSCVDAQAQQIDGEFTVLAGSGSWRLGTAWVRRRARSRPTRRIGPSTSGSWRMAPSPSRTGPAFSPGTSSSGHPPPQGPSRSDGPATDAASGSGRTARCSAPGRVAGSSDANSSRVGDRRLLNIDAFSTRPPRPPAKLHITGNR